MSAPQPPYKRRVFYIPGFDPAPARRYREIYRREGLKQAKISGYTLNTLGKNAATGLHGWRARIQEQGRISEVEVKVLVWRDIVKDEMAGGICATYGQLFRTAWAYIGSGALWRLMRLRRGPVLAALYPVVLLLAQLLLALGAAGALIWAGHAAIAGLAGWALGALAAVGAFVGILRLFQKYDGRFYAYYLMHDYAFAARWRGANPVRLEQRLAEWTDEIREALAEGYDEILVVGHSSGAHLAVSVLADLLRAGLPAARSELGFLSLGQCMPMMTFLPDAHRLRADLQLMAEQDDIVWIDYSAPGDACSFALCDPVAVSGVAREAQKWPIVRTAAFTKTLSVERQKAMKWHFFERHFQYLASFDQPLDYDYFQITAGALTLRERFAHLQHTPSRITVPVNKYKQIHSNERRPAPS